MTENEYIMVVSSIVFYLQIFYFFIFIDNYNGVRNLKLNIFDIPLYKIENANQATKLLVISFSKKKKVVGYIKHSNYSQIYPTNWTNELVPWFIERFEFLIEPIKYMIRVNIIKPNEFFVTRSFMMGSFKTHVYFYVLQINIYLFLKITFL